MCKGYALRFLAPDCIDVCPNHWNLEAICNKKPINLLPVLCPFRDKANEKIIPVFSMCPDHTAGKK